MKYFKYVIFPFFCTLLSAVSFSGYVYDYNQNFKHNALITILNQQSEAIEKTLSDKQGYFFIENLKKGSYMIEASHIGFETYKHILNISGDLIVDILLKDVNIPMDRTVVTGTRSLRHIKDTPVLTHLITNKDIKNASYATVKNMLEITMPNVQIVESNHGNDRVKFQGLDNKYLTFLIDGDRVSGEFAGNIDFSMFGLSNVEKIEVIEGAMSTLYGSSAMGGVINIITKLLVMVLIVLLGTRLIALEIWMAMDLMTSS